MAPVASSAAEQASPVKTAVCEENASQKIQDEEMHVRRIQEWWSNGQGPAAASRNPILAAIDTSILAELVNAAGGYHSVLSADRLDGLHRRLGSGTEPALEPLRKALQTRGGAKSQARVVGMLLFKEARALHLSCENGTISALPPAEEVAATGGEAMAPTQEVVKLDESWPTPRLYVCSDSYPEGAQMALRSGPSSKSSLLATLPANTEYHATGIAGDFLQVRVTIDGTVTSAYALHKMGDMVLLVLAPPASSPVASPRASPAASPRGYPAAPTAPAAQAAALEEKWSSARRYICSESYPEGAQMAVRAAPSRESKQVATVGAGAEYWATGRSGDYLQIRLEIDGVLTTAYVTHTIGAMVLLVPAEPEPAATSATAAPAARAAAAAMAAAEAATAAATAEAVTGSRVVTLEAKVSAQQQEIQVLKAEMAQMRAQLSAVAAAFRPLSTGA